MAQTRSTPASELTKRTPKSEIQGLGWTQIPGVAENVAASPDGSLWVVSAVFQGPSGNAIWHYAGGLWTDIGGAATRLSVGPDGSLWALNGLGGIYHFKNGNWSQIAGGASDISAGPDGSLYVISSIYGNPYGNAIFHYTDGAWTQLPGAGVRIAASWDTGTYPNGISPGGFYLTNAQGSIFYYSPSTGYVQLPGAAAQLAPTAAGGLFALGYPASATNGDPIYYDDVSTGNWTLQAGAGVSLATNGSSVYVTGPAGGIYAAPVIPTIPGSLTGPSVSPTGAWGPTAVANALEYPVQNGFDGTGSTVAIVIDSSVYASDLQQYFSYFQTPATNRTITVRLVDGAPAAPTTAGVTEASLDVETVAGLAPGANVILYVVPSLTAQSEVDAYNAIISDGLASIVSSSFGGCEANAPYNGISTVFEVGANSGVAFIAASGDAGSACFSGVDSHGRPLYSIGVNYPASDPNVTGVGGTETDPRFFSLTSNTVWNDRLSVNGQAASGGGVSAAFGIPWYQQGLAGPASTQFRNVPDVSMPAVDAPTFVTHAWDSLLGTSWAAPEFAAMLAEVYQYCGTAFTDAASLPYVVNSSAGYGAFVDVINGNIQFEMPFGPSPAYAATPGYDNATGIGVPLGMPFAQTLCPNRVPAFHARAQTARSRALAFRAGRPAVLDATPKARNLVDLGRKGQSERVRVQLVLHSGSNTADNEQAVSTILRTAGFSIDKVFKNHLVIDATLPSTKAEQFFHTRIDNVWQHRPRVAYMPVTPVTIPASLAQYVAGISLDTVENMASPAR